MVDVSIHDNILDIEVEGVDKVLTLRSHLEIPLDNVKRIHKETAATERWWNDFREPVFKFPSMVMAGTFYQKGKRIFCDIRNPDRSIVIDLDDEQFNELIVEVANPQAVIAQVQAAMKLSKKDSASRAYH